MKSFATTEDLAAFWRPLSPFEAQRAAHLLQMASDRIWLLLKKSRKLPRIGEPVFSELYKDNLKWVTMSAVVRAMKTPIDEPSVKTSQQMVGSFQEIRTYDNPSGEIYLKKDEKKLLGLSAFKVGSIMPRIGREEDPS